MTRSIIIEEGRMRLSHPLMTALFLLAPTWAAATPPQFSSFSHYTVLGDPTRLHAAPMDARPGNDLVAVVGNRFIYVIPNDGTGAMLAPIRFNMRSVADVLPTDFDGDGDTDCLVNVYPVILLVNDGNGNFTPQTLGQFAIGGLAVLDVDGQNAGDIATSVCCFVPGADGDLRIYPRNPDGSVLPTSPSRPIFPTGTPRELAAADVNRDGHPDLLGAGVNTLHVMLGDGTGLANPVTYLGAPNPAQLLVANIDGDVWPDALINEPQYGRAWLYRNAGDGTFLPREEIDFTSVPSRIALADLDRDGDPDLVMLDAAGNRVLVRENDGAGHFGPEQVIGTLDAPPLDFVLFDADGDGDPDLGVSTVLGASGNVHVAINQTGDPLDAGGARVAGVTLTAAPIPFTTGTRVWLATGAPGFARVALYDLAGRRVRELWSGPVTAGRHAFAWDGRDADGRPVRTGAYVVRATCGGATRTLLVPRVR
jgi:VCBS repeat protein/flagellar hook capping protein FlgD